MPSGALSEFAAEAAKVLATLDLNDEHARTALADRVLAVGVTPCMHADQLTLPKPPRWITGDMSVNKAASISIYNLEVQTEAMQAIKTWSREKQIEYKLGQLLPLLQRPIPQISDVAAARIRRNLLDLVATDPSTS
ncbi:hypothetical protein [Amycolatopsis sp. NPDC004079]|uniref:hypothetical protein n=1 Tax=Amycolatopsis sp. NPDC004079 TaxID=3154549 RepID=UPI00339DCCED